MLALVVTPSRRLVLERLEAGAATAAAGAWAEPELGARLEAAFAESAAAGLLALATAAQEAVPSPAFAWWRKVPERFLTELCHLPNSEGMPLVFPPPDGFIEETLEARPPFPGAEYVDTGMLGTLWDGLAEFARARSAPAAGCQPLTTIGNRQSKIEDPPPAGGVAEWVRSLGGVWSRVGRVWFHLAENPRGGPEQPFAFMATYSKKALAGGKVQFRQLGKALEEYAGAGNRKALANLLTPVEGAAKRLAWVQGLVASGEIFHPLAWSAAEAKGFIDAIPALEECGVLTRLPQKWLRGPARVKVNVKVGASPADGLLGKGALLDFNATLALDGEPLTAAEADAILSGTGGLLMLRGQWVQVDKESLEKALDAWRRWEDGVDFRQALRLVAGLDGDEAQSGGWVEVQAGAWLAERLERLRAPDRIPGGNGERIAGLVATLRPYQEAGVRWLRFVTGLGLGGCLADDMGLGKTVQVLALLLAERNEGDERRRAAGDTTATTFEDRKSAIENPPALLVVPASLLSNWLAEAAKFAPSLRIRCAHPAFDGAEKPADLAGFDAVLTTYGMLHRTPWLAEAEWGLAVLDEAQAIKNPGTRQTRAVKQVRARARLAMTGTPVENRLGDLWSIFDFLNPGLLGSQKQFDAQVDGLEKRGGYAPLRRLVSPYLLRRLKTDKTVIADLPDKVEAKAWCGLSRRQAALYAGLTEQFRADLEEAEGIGRRGLVLAYLMRFKQLCNHPSQWLSDGVFEPADSGKFGRLRAIAEEVAQRQEKLLVFTQFKEMTEPLHRFLAGIFGRPGLMLHGGVAVGKRQDLVAAFQDEAGPPYFVLSVKAGGTGLNLTAASHVVHFDRWWNPAVEDQATDRAFRIGQKRNVMVHKFICRGTFEEKIDAMIEAKQAMAREVVGDGGGEAALTELDNRQILELVKLDIRSATAEEE